MCVVGQQHEIRLLGNFTFQYFFHGVPLKVSFSYEMVFMFITSRNLLGKIKESKSTALVQMSDFRFDNSQSSQTNL
jgi:hypothetical protein